MTTEKRRLAFIHPTAIDEREPAGRADSNGHLGLVEKPVVCVT